MTNINEILKRAQELDTYTYNNINKKEDPQMLIKRIGSKITLILPNWQEVKGTLKNTTNFLIIISDGDTQKFYYKHNLIGYYFE